MSEQPKWMPSDEEIAAAWSPEEPVVHEVRALISTAVEKALAEQMEKLVSDDGIKFDGWPDGTDMAREIEWATGVILADDRLHRCVNFMVAGRAQARVNKALAEKAGQNLIEALKVVKECERTIAEQEARHKRQLIEARIEELEMLDTLDMGAYYEISLEAFDGRLGDLRAELAALDTEQQGGAERRYEPHTREELAEFARRASEFKVDVLKGLSALDSAEPQEPGQPAPEVKP